MSLQLEESEFTCAAAVKARKSMEVEIEDLHLQIDDLAKAKAAVSGFGVPCTVVGPCPTCTQWETPSSIAGCPHAIWDGFGGGCPSPRGAAGDTGVSLQLEEQLSRLQREKNEVQSRLEEDQEDMNELMKKHKAAVAQVRGEQQLWHHHPPINTLLGAGTMGSPLTLWCVPQASRDLAQMNDLQAQLEEVSKEKQELQEKVGSTDIGHAPQVKVAVAPRDPLPTLWRAPHPGGRRAPRGALCWVEDSVASSSAPGQHGERLRGWWSMLRLCPPCSCKACRASWSSWSNPWWTSRW